MVRQKYDFAVAYPDPESLPLDDLLESLKGALDDEGQDLAIYPHTQGYPPLREYVAQKLEDDRGITISPDEIVMGDGSSQPIHMLVEALIDPGDVVLTEDFVYSGTLNILRRFQADRARRGVRRRGDSPGRAGVGDQQGGLGGPAAQDGLHDTHVPETRRAGR